MNTYIFKVLPTGELIEVQATNPIQGDRLAWLQIPAEQQDSVLRLELSEIILEGEK